MNRGLVIPKDKIAAFCQRHHICRLSVFGSALRKDFSTESDVDIIVEFQTGYEPGFAFFDMEDELSRVLDRKVDLNTPNFLSRYFRQTVVKNAELRYALRRRPSKDYLVGRTDTCVI